MLITASQASWHDMSEAPERIKNRAVGQQLASVLEFGSEWQQSLVFESTAFGAKQILAGVLALLVSSFVVWAKLISLSLSFHIYKMNYQQALQRVVVRIKRSTYYLHKRLLSAYHVPGASSGSTTVNTLGSIPALIEFVLQGEETGL